MVDMHLTYAYYFEISQNWNSSTVELQLLLEILLEISFMCWNSKIAYIFFKKSDNAQNSNNFSSKFIMNQKLLKISLDFFLSHLKNPMYIIIRISCGRVLVGTGQRLYYSLLKIEGKWLCEEWWLSIPYK